MLCFFFTGKTQDLHVHIFTTGMVLALLFPLVAVAVVFVFVIFRVDFVLFYRNICRRDDTAGGMNLLMLTLK